MSFCIDRLGDKPLLTRGRAFREYDPLYLGKFGIASLSEIDVTKEMNMLYGNDPDDDMDWIRANPTLLPWKPWGEKVREVDKMGTTLKIKAVIFNEPATIVFWEDGTKTVVKAIDEPFDPEKGLAMAYVKKLHGNTGKYNNEIKKWTREYGKNESLMLNPSEGLKWLSDSIQRCFGFALIDKKETIAEYCENDVAMTKEAYEALEETKKWVPITDYPNYEIDNRTNVRNTNTHRIIPAKYDSEGKPYYMIYDRKLGRSRRVYLKDIKIK